MSTRIWTVSGALGLLCVSVISAQPRPLAPNVARYVSVNAPVVALTHVRVVDGTGAPAREDQTIIVRDSRIEAVGSASAAKIPAGAQVLDLTGSTVIPGLVGLHEHTWFGGMQVSTPMSVTAPLLYLGLGVTTAMTAGTMFAYQELNLQRAVDAGVVPGPRFLIAGPYLSAGPPSAASGDRSLTTPEETRRVIAYWASEGATWFKFLGGETRAELAAGIKEAHARGLKVTGHLCSITFTEASELGIDLLQHGFITNSDYVPGKKPDVCPPENMKVQADVDVNSPEVQASIRAIVSHGTAVASTLGVYETFVPERAHLDSAAMEMLSPAARAEVQANNAGLAQSGFTVPVRLLKKMMESRLRSRRRTAGCRLRPMGHRLSARLRRSSKLRDADRSGVHRRGDGSDHDVEWRTHRGQGQGDRLDRTRQDGGPGRHPRQSGADATRHLQRRDSL